MWFLNYKLGRSAMFKYYRPYLHELRTDLGKGHRVPSRYNIISNIKSSQYLGLHNFFN